MTRLIACIKIFFFFIFFLSTGSIEAQEEILSPDILKNLSIDPSSIPADQRAKINARVNELKSEGLSDTEILNRLVEEGLVPESVRAEILSSQPSESPTPQTVDPTSSPPNNPATISRPPANPTPAQVAPPPKAPPPAQTYSAIQQYFRHIRSSYFSRYYRRFHNGFESHSTR